MSEEDAEDAPLTVEDGGQSIVDELKEVNLGSIEGHAQLSLVHLSQGRRRANI